MSRGLGDVYKRQLFIKVRGLQRSNLFCLNLRKSMASGKVDCQMMRGMKIFSDGKR